MKTKLILTTTIAILAFAPCLLAEDAKYPPINPALTYWQSAAVMPDLKGEKSHLLNDAISRKIPLDDARVKELLSQGEQSLNLFAKAAASPAPCDWGLDLTQGPALALPHISKMMELSHLAVLKADVLFSEGKTDEGIDWLLTAHRAARHAGAGDLLICELVQTAIESSAISAAGQHCLGWNEETRKKYADGLKALPPMHTFQDSIQGEMLTLDWIERLFNPNDPKKRKELDDTLLRTDSSKQPSEMEATIKLFHEQFTPESSLKHFAEMRDIYRRTQEAFGKPWKESQAELEALGKEAENGNILMKLIYPASQSVNIRRFEIDTLHTMLDAALQYGPKLDEAAAATFKDSFEGDPLVLKKVDDSLTLTTAKQYRKGKDTQLKLGK